VRCAACGLRTARGFGWFDPRDLASRQHPACSMRCMDALCRRWGVVDPDEHETAAIEAASPLAGEYLESIGKTDLASLTEAEWLTLLMVVVIAFQNELARRLDTGRHPAPPLRAATGGSGLR
jgi:DNA polymerase III epsilon subunit-like protein